MSRLPEPDRPVLIIQHAPFEHPASVLRALDCLGVPSRWIHPYRGENYPELGSVQGVISLGGPMGANDEKEHPWIADEVALLRKSVTEGLPTVGICLGGQMMARALGGRVFRNEVPEIGWHPLTLNEEGRANPLLSAAGEKPLLFHWHNDTFELPPGARLLASSDACPRQAYQVGDSAYGFQFHPEADAALVREWLEAEGSAQEILESQKRHGTPTIQAPETQRLHAPLGELASVKVSTAIAQFFETRAYEGSPAGTLLGSIREWERARLPVETEIRGSSPRAARLRGTLVETFRLQAGDFLMIRETASGLLWPVRLDRIHSIKKV